MELKPKCIAAIVSTFNHYEKSNENANIGVVWGVRGIPRSLAS